MKLEKNKTKQKTVETTKKERVGGKKKTKPKTKT